MSQAPLPHAPADLTPPLERFLEANFKKLLLLFGAATVAVVLYGFASYASKAKAVQAGERFASAKTVEDCDLLLSEFPGTVAAGNALLLKADLLWAQNKKDSSVAALREFTTGQTKHPLLAEALLALASKLDAMGEADEARPVLERLVAEYADADVAALAQIRLADLLWAAGKEAEAKAAYEAVPAKFPNASSDFLEQSESRLKWIAAKLPTKEVDGPPKPKSAPAPEAPKLNLNNGGTLSPTLLPAGAPKAAAPATPAAPKVEAKPVPAPAPAPAKAP